MIIAGYVGQRVKAFLFSLAFVTLLHWSKKRERLSVSLDLFAAQIAYVKVAFKRTTEKHLSRLKPIWQRSFYLSRDVYKSNFLYPRREMCVAFSWKLPMPSYVASQDVLSRYYTPR